MRSGSTKNLSSAKGRKYDGAGVLIAPDPARDRLDLAAEFGNDRPVEVEIGTGKGTFLLERAQQRPEVNFLGIEQAKAYGMYAADRFRRHGLDNVRMICADAGAIVRNCLDDASVFRLHIYFPDPWPKRRHHRRRLIQPWFIREARRILAPGGQLLIKTDHQGYFEWMRRVLHDVPGLARTDFPRVVGSEDKGMVGTNFERKYIREGRPFYKLAFLRYV
jgi:tRNA (guanine-N7-)-methyltransferase